METFSEYGSTPVTESQASSGSVAIMETEEAYNVHRTIMARPAFLPWKEIVDKAKQERATDIVFNKGKVYMRISGELGMLSHAFQPVEQNYEKALISTIPDERHLIELLSEHGATDFGFTVEGVRMRGNIYRELHGFNGVFRPIADEILSDAMLMLDPQVLDVILKSRQGLVLITGPTGSGKSAMVAAILEKINQTFCCNIITVEDPIEFIFTPKKCTFSQRELGQHVESFDTALRSSLRQNPDVIFVGEIRDYSTLIAALKAAETGHLVFTTLHTRRVYTTLNRLLQLAPATERDAIRDAIAQNLLMIMCQNLLSKKGGGLVPCREVVIRNNAVIACINSGKVREINNVMLGNRPMGMIDWSSALAVLVQNRLITEEEAALYRDREADV